MIVLFCVREIESAEHLSAWISWPAETHNNNIFLRARFSLIRGPCFFSIIYFTTIQVMQLSSWHHWIIIQSCQIHNNPAPTQELHAELSCSAHIIRTQKQTQRVPWSVILHASVPFCTMSHSHSYRGSGFILSQHSILQDPESFSNSILGIIATWSIVELFTFQIKWVLAYFLCTTIVESDDTPH
jgi:hypothetical protein